MRAEEHHAAKLSPLVKIVWSEHSLENLTRIIKNYINNDDSAIFMEVINDQYVGVALCCLWHDYVEGCTTSPVGYLEGVCVQEQFRHQGIAKKLVSECEKWAKEKGCTEFASDCALTNSSSLKFHLSVGFNEENRIICFKKML